MLGIAWQSLVQQLEKGIETGFWRILQILILFILSRLLISLAHKMVRRILYAKTVKMSDRRRDTLESLFTNSIKYIIYFAFLLMALQTLNFQIMTLLAGAGIAGIAIGFGAKNLIQDILTGFFILFEDQYGVGDLIQINQFTGKVISVGLRLTRVQAWTGEIATIPNGQIQQVINYSKANSVAVIDVGVSYDTNVDHALQVLEQVMKELKTENEDIVEVEVLGVQTIRSNDIVLRATAECQPTTHFAVQRLAQKRIKQAFAETGIEMPVPQAIVAFRQKPQV